MYVCMYVCVHACSCCCVWSLTSTLYKPVNNELTVGDYLRPLAVINLSTRLEAIKPAQVHHGPGCSVFSGTPWTPPVHAKSRTGLDRKPPGRGRQVTVIESRPIHLPPFFSSFFFLPPSDARRTRCVKPEHPSCWRVLFACSGRMSWQGHGRGVEKKKQPLPTKVCAQDQIAVRECVRAEDENDMIYPDCACTLVLSACLPFWNICFFQIRPVEPLLSPPVNSFFKIIKNNQHSSSAQSFNYEDLALRIDPGSLAALAHSKLAGHCCFQQLVRGIRRIIAMQSCFYVMKIRILTRMLSKFSFSLQFSDTAIEISERRHSGTSKTRSWA